MPQRDNLFPNGPPSDFFMQMALEQIYDDHGCIAEYKAKTLAKFGRYALLGTSYETVQSQGGTEIPLNDNLIDTIVSTDAGDTQNVVIEGHTIDSLGNLTFVVQTATLTGLTNVTLSTPLARATRLYNDNATDFAGTVKVFDASFPAVVYVEAIGTYNQSEKVSTSTSSVDFWVIGKVYGVVLQKTSATVDFSLQVRRQGKVFREVYAWGANNASSPTPHILNVPIIIPPNSDVRVQAKATTTNVEVLARVAGHLALVTDPWNYTG